MNSLKGLPIDLLLQVERLFYANAWKNDRDFR
jgi:hypothetical protein